MESMMNSKGSEINKIEFDVNLTCNNCAAAVRNALSSYSNSIRQLNIDVERQSVIVETSLPSQTIKEGIESTGKRAVLKGFGVSDLGSAVAEVKNINGVLGVIRFHQKNQELCVIDGTIDGLIPGEYGLHIHEFGDLSDFTNSIGDLYDPDFASSSDKRRKYGDLGNITADNKGRSSFVIEDGIIKVWDIIGRSIAVSKSESVKNEKSTLNGNYGSILACAIIARSSGLFQNPKRLCQCDGVSIWDEQSVPASSL